MPPFEYRGYSNPYVQAMSQAMLAPGQIEAQRAQAVANAQGNAAIASGNAWGNAIQHIGQTVAQIPQQIQAQKMAALKMQDMQGQIGERNALAQKREADLAGQARDQRAAQMWSEQLKANVDPKTGEPNYDAAAKAVAEYFPVQANTFLEGVTKTQASRNALIESQQKIDKAKKDAQAALSNHMGELAAVGLDKLQTDTPQNARDHFLGLIASAAATGAISETDAHDALLQTAAAGPQQLAAVYQHFLDQAPDVKKRLIDEAEKKAQTEKALAEAAKARRDEKTVTEATLDAYAQSLYAKKNANQPLSDMEAANLKAYEDRKRVVADPTMLAESQRQTRSIDQQNALQKSAQGFQELQAGRKELSDKVIAPYQQALTSAQTLRDTVSAAKAGNKIAANLQALEGTMAAIRAQGLNRINTTELGVAANAGSLYDAIVGRLGKLDSGQPMPADLQKDLSQFAGILEKAAYKKYSEGHTATTSLYHMNEKPLAGPMIYARDRRGVLHTAPWGTKIPADWTQE